MTSKAETCTLTARISIEQDGNIHILIPAKDTQGLDFHSMKSLQTLKSWYNLEPGESIHGDTMIHSRVESIDYTRANLIGVNVPLSDKVATVANPNPAK